MHARRGRPSLLRSELPVSIHAFCHAAIEDDDCRFAVLFGTLLSAPSAAAAAEMSASMLLLHAPGPSLIGVAKIDVSTVRPEASSEQSDAA